MSFHSSHPLDNNESYNGIVLQSPPHHHPISTFRPYFSMNVRLVVVVLFGVLDGNDSLHLISTRRNILTTSLSFFVTTSSSSASSSSSEQQVVQGQGGSEERIPSSLLVSSLSKQQMKQGFVYNHEWTGTTLDVMSLEEAVESAAAESAAAAATTTTPTTNPSTTVWKMAQWPDPILRQVAQPVDEIWYGTITLQRAAQLLQDTAQYHNAVGLAAQQCGVNARMIYLETTTASHSHSSPPRTTATTTMTTKTATGSRFRPNSILMINPTIVERSPEWEMRVWEEQCLVLPPSFRATVLRDAWIVVEYYDVTDPTTTVHSIRLTGEAARAAQHELDHDRGILTLDHVGLEDMENDIMRSFEREGHDARQKIAFSRNVDTKRVPPKRTWEQTSPLVLR